MPNNIELRDYFAGQVLQGLLANNDLQKRFLRDSKALVKSFGLENEEGKVAENMQYHHAMIAYKFADAMIKEKGGKMREEARQEMINLKASITMLNQQPLPEIIGICKGVKNGEAIQRLFSEERMTIMCYLTFENMAESTLDQKLLKKIKEIRIYGDNDKAGREASKSCYDYLLKAKDIFNLSLKIKAIEYPTNNLNDFNDVLNLAKNEALQYKT